MLVGASGNLVGVEVPPWRGGDGKAVAPELDKCLEYADGTSRQCSPSGLQDALRNEGPRIRHSRNASLDLDAELQHERHTARARHSRNLSSCSLGSICSAHFAEDVQSCPALLPDTLGDAGDRMPLDDRHVETKNVCYDRQVVEKDSLVKEAAGGKSTISWCTCFAQFVRPGRARDMSLLMTITFFLFMDQSILAPNMSVGYYADRANRKNLVTAITIFGELGVLMTYWVEEYWQLLILRLMTGVSLGDMYSPEERPRANMYAGLASNLGVGLGQVLATTTGSYIGWRLPFLLSAAPCLFILTIFHFATEEPIQGAQELRQYFKQESTQPERACETAAREEGLNNETGWNNTDERLHISCSRDLTSEQGCGARDIDSQNKQSPTRNSCPASQLTVQELQVSDVNEFGVALVVDGLCVRHTRNMSWCSITSICSAHLAEEDTAEFMSLSDLPLLRTNSNVGVVSSCPDAPSAPRSSTDTTPAAQASAAALQHAARNSLPGKATTRTCATNSVLGQFVLLCSVKSNVILWVRGILECMPWGVINVFMADYLLVDRKAHSDFLSDKLAAWTVCGAFGIGSLAGSIIGGEVGSRIYLWKKNWIAYLLGICQILAILPQVLVLNLPFQLETLVPINFIGGILISISRPNLQTIVLNINAPNIHGTASAWWSIFGDISAGIGPPLVALLVVAYGRQMAFSISFAIWFLNGLVTMLLSFTLVANEDRVVAQAVAQQIRSRKDENIVEDRQESRTICSLN